jgi:hypothetical protein
MNSNTKYEAAVISTAQGGWVIYVFREDREAPLLISNITKRDLKRARRHWNSEYTWLSAECYRLMDQVAKSDLLDGYRNTTMTVKKEYRLP